MHLKKNQQGLVHATQPTLRDGPQSKLYCHTNIAELYTTMQLGVVEYDSK
jgi:hypothetical protein